jgi:hypothetical protein
MRIAYLITAYDHPSQLARLVNRIKTRYSHVFIHVDGRSTLSPFSDALPVENGIEFIQDRVDVNWMGFSQVRSILALLRRAAQEQFDYCVLLSGSDYPIKSNEQIEAFYRGATREYINFWQLDDRPSWKHKVLYHYPIDWVPIHGYSKNCEPSFWVRYFWGRFFKYQQYLPKRTFLKGLTPCGGSDWWSISRECVDYILHYVDAHPEYVNFYRFTHCPSEMFFHTIIFNSPLRTRLQNFEEYMAWSASTSVDDKLREDSMLAEDTFNFRYIDWSGNLTRQRETPAILDERDWDALAYSADLFARKFHPVHSAAVLDRIDRELLKVTGK